MISLPLNKKGKQNNNYIQILYNCIPLIEFPVMKSFISLYLYL